jgi:hypothetical protein
VPVRIEDRLVGVLALFFSTAQARPEAALRPGYDIDQAWFSGDNDGGRFFEGGGLQADCRRS